MPVSGIRGAHNIRLGSHLCLFYRRPQEYLQVTASFLKAGIVKNEFCVWVLPPPLTIAFALDELLYCGLNGPRRVGHGEVPKSAGRLTFDGSASWI